MRKTILFLSILFASFSAASLESDMKINQKMIAVTIDDVPHAGPLVSAKEMINLTETLLKSLKKHNIPAIGFVNEKLLYSNPVEVEQATEVLRMWVDSGFELGNHTFSHFSLSNMPLDKFEDDVLKGELVTRKFLEEKGMKLRYFRHPFLDVGPTLLVKQAFEQFLKEHGYLVAPVTIDAADWKYNLVYIEAKKNNDKEAMGRVVTEYLELTDKRIDFTEQVSKNILGYQPRQILLIHDNELNSEHMDELANLIKRKGYLFVSLEEALKDKIYSLTDNYVGLQGTWLEHWAQTLNIRINWHNAPMPSEYILNKFNELMKQPAKVGSPVIYGESNK